jgi:hypothetical protein
MFFIASLNANNGNAKGITCSWDDGGHTIKNNAIVNVRQMAGGDAWCYDTNLTSSDFDYNIDSDGTAPGTNTKTTAQDGSGIFTGITDLRLPDTSSDAYQFAENVGASFPLASVDIRGRDRTAQGDTWDCGGYQLIVIPPPPDNNRRLPLLFSMW